MTGFTPFVAGNVLTAAQMNSLLPIYVIKLATETMTTRLASVTAALEKLPLIEQRLGQMEDEQAKLRQKVYSDHPRKHADLDSKLAVLAEKAASTDKFKAVRLGSNPDFGNGNGE